MHDFRRTAKILAKHSPHSSKEIFNRIVKSQIYKLFSQGMISKLNFYSEISSELRLLISYVNFVKAWNKTHTGVNNDFVRLIEKLFRQGYKFHLLSNIDEIHWEEAQEPCAEVFEFFESFHLSFEIGMKKPNPLIFLEVLNYLNLEPEQCLFIDDLEENVRIAENLGIRSLIYDKKKHKKFVKEINKLLS